MSLSSTTLILFTSQLWEMNGGCSVKYRMKKFSVKKKVGDIRDNRPTSSSFNERKSFQWFSEMRKERGVLLIDMRLKNLKKR
jgi:hypothetical protein